MIAERTHQQTLVHAAYAFDVAPTTAFGYGKYIRMSVYRAPLVSGSTPCMRLPRCMAASPWEQGCGSQSTNGG